jgi:hypothetical protein
MPREASALLSAAVILSAFYFYHESDKTVERLAQTRREITAFPVSKQSNESKLQKKSFMGRLLQKRKLPVKQSET